MASILNNVVALGASRQLGITGEGLQRTIERLTTGRRINRASDDAAGLGISNRLGADIRIANQARRNANDSVSYLQVADGVLDEVTSLLTRAAELAQQAQTGTVDTAGRTSLDGEYQKIATNIKGILTNTQFNGRAVFGSSALTVQVGTYGQITVGVDASTVSGATFSDLTSVSNASTVQALLTTTTVTISGVGYSGLLGAVSAIRGGIGAGQQQLISISNSLGISVENQTAAYSQILDANISDEVVNLTKFQILNQSGTSALAQANQSSQSILALLR